jgi:hypothetical protein
VSGAWEERGIASDYLEKASVHCECCGRMIVRLAWVVDDVVFCEPECEKLWQSYLMPRKQPAA